MACFLEETTAELCHSPDESWLKDSQIRYEITTDGLSPQEISAAVQYYSKLIDIFPKDSFILSILGSIYGCQGQYKQAINCFERILELEPQSLQACRSLGAAYYKLNNY
jgi:tetratricopeptide (TPR) repeat protein